MYNYRVTQAQMPSGAYGQLYYTLKKYDRHIVPSLYLSLIQADSIFKCVTVGLLRTAMEQHLPILTTDIAIPESK